MYDCRLLPAYASFIIDHQLENFAKAQVALSFEVNLPLLAALKLRYTEDQIKQLAITAAKDYLQYLAENRAFDQLTGSMEKWIHNRLEIVGKLEVSAQDITLI